MPRWLIEGQQELVLSAGVFLYSLRMYRLLIAAGDI